MVDDEIVSGIVADSCGGGPGGGFATSAAESDSHGRPGSQPAARPVTLEEVVWGRPVFVVGCPRSGTTLVQTILDSHPRLSVLYEADALVDIPLGPRSCLVNASEALTLAEAHWSLQGRSFDVEMARTACKELGIADAAGAMRVLAALQAFAQGKSRWGNKKPKAVLHLAELATLYPDAQFVHVIRDGRHVASSQARLFDCNAAQGALLWRTAIRTGRRAGSRLGPSRYLEMRLEELLSSPEEQIGRMCAFLGEDFDQSMLYSNLTAKERIPAASLKFHPRLGESPQPCRQNRDSAETGLVQRGASALMDAELVELGYVPATSLGRARRFIHVIIGYTFVLVRFRKSWWELFRHFARSVGARSAARRLARQATFGRQSQGSILLRQQAKPASAEALEEL